MHFTPHERSFRAPQAEQLRYIHVLYMGVDINGSPQPLTVLPGPIDPATTTAGLLFPSEFGTTKLLGVVAEWPSDLLVANVPVTFAVTARDKESAAERVCLS